ncbi:MAG TPA: hypothetical protein VKQ05_01835 [Gemmatimonadales bacterium]|nr:hypothetical protein [Gemmatimonadales bacterium]
MPSYEVELLQAARNVARLRLRRAHFKRELKRVASELRAEERHVRALIGAKDERRPDVMPSRVFGDGVGYVAKTRVEKG